MTTSGDKKAVNPPAASAARRVRRLLPRWATSNVAAGIVLVAAIAVPFFTTWLLLSPAVESFEPAGIDLMIVSNVLIALIFATLIFLRFWHVLSDRRHRLAGSRTHLQLVGIFSIVAVAPSIIAFLFAFTILRTSLNDVFSDRIERYHRTARELANGLVLAKSAELQSKMRDIAFDIQRNEQAGVGLEETPISFRQYIYIQAEVRGLAAIYIIDGENQILVRAEVVERGYNLPSQADLERLRTGRPGELLSVGANDDVTYDLFRGVVRLPFYNGGYLIVYQPIDADTSKLLQAVVAQRADWREAEDSRAQAERVFLGGYLLLALIILCAAVWLGLWAATRIVQPIGRLIGMADRVSSGDLAARVEVHKSDGELGALARSMNHMTAQIQTQRDDLIETNRQFDLRRRFTEAVLSGVPAGVVGLSADGRVTIANKAAAETLGVDGARVVGTPIVDIVPELAALLEAVSDARQADAAAQIELVRNDVAKTINVRVVADEVDGERSFVVTFDDITQLIAAQRNAAWGDVARRIAHEIKNPLTPIQLSAERLRRKYLSEITSSPDIFDKCTDTIIRHVNDIGRMVDEFSSFARMPKPVMAQEDLRELIKAAIFPQRVAAPEIDFALDAPDHPVWSRCDGRLIVQALSNLLKNASESIGARVAAQTDPAPGRIRVVLSGAIDKARIDVIDNGIGLPKAERHRLTEPYMTTRAKGTGLGLAIVRKVIEDHGGALSFDDDATLGASGARVSIVLPGESAVEPGEIKTAAE